MRVLQFHDLMNMAPPSPDPIRRPTYKVQWIYSHLWRLKKAGERITVIMDRNYYPLQAELPHGVRYVADRIEIHHPDGRVEVTKDLTA